MTKKLTFAALIIAIGTLTSHVVYIPVGVSKCFPMQHAINVFSAVLLGARYAVGNAFTISLLRNILGTGSVLAFPGSMVGAFLSGLLYQKTHKLYWAVIGEVFGTGLLGSLLSFPIAKFLLGKDVAALFFVAPFLVSTIGGSLLAYLICSHAAIRKILDNNPFQEPKHLG